jgi:hypothetical protein
MIDATISQTVVRVHASAVEDDRVIHARIRSEYHEMPGLSLTLSQAARLFNLELVRCARVMDALVTDGALWSNGRTFLGSNAGRHSA